MLILLLFLLLTCCADCGVYERPAAYPFLCYFMHGRLVVLAPCLCVVPLSIVSEALHLPLWLQVTTARAYRGYCCVSVAEADVRVRVRGRVVSVHRQRGQVRVVSVVAAAETTNRRISAAALSFCERTQPHHLTGTPIPLCALVGGMDFCFNDVAPHLHTMPAKCCMGFTRQKRGHPHRWR